MEVSLGESLMLEANLWLVNVGCDVRYSWGSPVGFLAPWGVVAFALEALWVDSITIAWILVELLYSYACKW